MLNCLILGAASSLADLRKDLESRTGLSEKELRIEKVCYTGKEGKTTQGCPMAKWVGIFSLFMISYKHKLFCYLYFSFEILGD